MKQKTKAGKTGKASVGKRKKTSAAARQASVAPVPELSSIRERIDDIDLRIHDLLNERARFAQQVGISKRDQGMSTADFYKPEREAQVLRQALERNKGPLRNEEIARLSARSCPRAWRSRSHSRSRFSARRARSRSRPC